MRTLEMSQSGGPWSWRAFTNQDDADRFHRRLSPDHPVPFQLGEPHVVPNGNVLRPGVWVVLYRPIIVDGQTGRRRGPPG